MGQLLPGLQSKAGTAMITKDPVSVGCHIATCETLHRRPGGNTIIQNISHLLNSLNLKIPLLDARNYTAKTR